VVSKLEARVKRFRTKKKKRRRKFLTGLWPWGDRTHPWRVRSFIAEVVVLVERVEEGPYVVT
jgi:hypothetical protein